MEASQAWVAPDPEPVEAFPAPGEPVHPPKKQKVQEGVACVAPHPEPVEAFQAPGEPVHPPKKVVQEDVVKWVEGIPFVQHYKDGNVYVGRVKLSIEGTIEKKIVKCHDCLCRAAVHGVQTNVLHLLLSHFTKALYALKADCRPTVPATQSS